MKVRDQSTAAPIRFRSFVVSRGKNSVQYTGSANFGISLSGMPILRRMSICFFSPSAMRSAAATIGVPVQWNANGNRVL